MIALGLTSRQYGDRLPQFIADYAGDTLWAIMAFLGVGVLAPRWPTLRLAIAALAIAYSVELSQLYHAAWIDAIRHTRLGGLVLGYGFLWSDIACYTVGVMTATVIETALMKRSHR